MPEVIREGNLEFEFSDQWQPVIKFDECTAYRNHIAKLEGTKAVDFLGILDQALYLIEVKDFRGHRIENQPRLSEGELAIEVGQKVRDSLAGIVGAYRTPSTTDDYTPFARILRHRDQIIRVIVWLEHDLPEYPPNRIKVRASVQANVFKAKLNWLTSHVLVSSHAENILSEVQVRNLPHS